MSEALFLLLFRDIRQKLKEEIAQIKEKYSGFAPGLAIVQVMLKYMYTELQIRRSNRDNLEIISHTSP